MSPKRYTAADIKTIVGMDRNTLFYVVKTLGIVRPAEKKARVTYYDFHALLDLALIQELLSLGITQGTIQGIINEPVTAEERFNLFYMGQSKEGRPIWENFRDDRGTYENDGCVLMLTRETKGHYYTMMSMKDALYDMKMFWLPQVDEIKKITRDGFEIKRPGSIPRPFGHVIIVDILGLVNRVEMLTGEKLS